MGMAMVTNWKLKNRIPKTNSEFMVSCLRLCETWNNLQSQIQEIEYRNNTKVSFNADCSGHKSPESMQQTEKKICSSNAWLGAHVYLEKTQQKDKEKLR